MSEQRMPSPLPEAGSVTGLASCPEPVAEVTTGAPPLDPDALAAEAGRRRIASIEHARAAEHLYLAALALNGSGPDWSHYVVAINREADDLLERSVTFRADACNLETLAERCRS